MVIKKIVHDEEQDSENGIFEELRRGDHVVFSLNDLGAGYEQAGAGYGLVAHIIENFCVEFKDTGKRELGEIVSHESESGIWFHGIVTHTVANGWEHDEYGTSSYMATQKALDALYEKWDDELTRDMRSVWLGRGKQRRVGEASGNINWMLQSMANTKLPLVVYILDGWYHENDDS